MAIESRAYRALLEGRAHGIGPGLLRSALWGASVLYGSGVGLRNALYDRGWLKSETAPVPVVSVGNLTAGGTGKTPCVEYLARFFRACQVRTAILSRGYGARAGLNDEAMVLRENLGDVLHLQGANRAVLAKTAVEARQSEVLILDDGFQHRALARNLDLVLVDATNPWGYGRLLPRGLLREPRPGLGRANLVLLTRCDQVGVNERGRLREEIARFAPNIEVAEAMHRPLEWVNSDGSMAPLATMRERPVAAFCGIGSPAAFGRTLELLDCPPVDLRVYADHHAYTAADRSELAEWADSQAKDAVVVTTQKDLVKLPFARLGGRELWALRIGFEVSDGRESLERKLLDLVASRRKQPLASRERQRPEDRNSCK